MNTSYLPVSDADRVLWLSNFANRLGQYRVTLGLTLAEVNGFSADADMYAYVVQQYDASRTYSQSLSNVKKALRSASQQLTMPALPAVPNIGNAPSAVNSGIFNRVSMLVMAIKQHAGYTAAMGQDLGIIAPASNSNPAALTPNLSVRIESGYPLLKWSKGDSDGAHVYVDRHDNQGFILLKHTVRNSYLDTSPLPPNTFAATWDYKIRYTIEDDEVGNYSPVISINIVRAS